MLVHWLLLGLAALIYPTESTNWGCYGNIRNIDTPGASCIIGRQRGLNYCGVRASERLAEMDLPYVQRYQPTLRVIGRKYCVDPALIAGIMSRESYGGNTGGVQHIPAYWTSEPRVAQITNNLTMRIKEIQRRFPTWTTDQYLRGGLCAYNKGIGYVRSNQDLSCDFCNDVLARARYYKRYGF
ncbi:lysozyme g-like protein 1 isoform X2 [Vombatus ursinus]|uniref:lysozyme g-like protein 1 isoform X2 n=1 Tax=Vombatus ursinus TaxID=29139 RepID=UPI000FFD6B80|nr:lysozyme g-like protein 1 isoform X2 [Vombatus ursinus]